MDLQSIVQLMSSPVEICVYLLLMIGGCVMVYTGGQPVIQIGDFPSLSC